MSVGVEGRKRRVQFERLIHVAPARNDWVALGNIVRLVLAFVLLGSPHYTAQEQHISMTWVHF